MPAYANLVHQTSITPGTGAQTLVAVLGKRSFLSGFGTGGTNTFDYSISHRTAAEFERGTGHEASGTLVRDTVLENHLGTTALVNFSAGMKDITNDQPAGKRVDGPVVAIANGGTNATTAAAALTSLGALPLAGGTLTGAVTFTVPGFWSHSGAGAGTYYSTNTVANRFFGGTETTGDFWRLYSAGFGNCVSFNGTNGNATFGAALSCGGFGCGSATMTGALYMDSASGNISTGGGGVFSGTGSTTGQYTSGGANFLQFKSGYDWRVGSTNDLSLVMNSATRAYWRGSSDYALIHLAEAYKPAGGSWVDSSDSRIKNIEGEYTRGLADVVQLRPVYYTFKGNDTDTPPANPQIIKNPMEPPEPDTRSAPTAAPYPNSPHFQVALKGTRYAGMIAQEVEVVFPEMVKPRAGYIDGVAVEDVRDLDTTPLVYALVNACKELKAQNESLAARIAALEAA